jgi:hypothetical protein
MESQLKKEVKHEKCNRCKCWRTVELFLNDKGRRLKTCTVCRERSKKAYLKRKARKAKKKEETEEE